SLTTAFGARAGIATVRNPFGPKPEDLPLADILADTGAPALGLAVVTDKEIKLIKVAGRRRIDRDDPVSEADLWDIGSNSKAMTAVAYGRLVE
ncbi:serine hydrolase, partial [Pseudomonas sp. FW306-02-H05-AA]|uniref:serine hydrolase n=1 Tax=Pseudomonas sp. FW306-02-H05-AA TaxID=2070657 RepID=UPI000CBFE71C